MRRMRRSTRYRLFSILIFFVVVSFLLGLVSIFEWREDSYVSIQQKKAYAQDVESSDLEVDVISGLKLDASKIVWEGERALYYMEDGRRLELSLVKALQDRLQEQLDGRKVPHGGVVAIEPSTGRVLAMVSASHSSPRIKDMALRAKSPAASVFKVITAAALLEQGRIDVNAKVCYNGGSSYLSESDVRGGGGSEKRCSTLEEALGHSINAVIARLAYQNLQREDFEQIVLKFGFNREIPFVFPVDVSEAEFVEDDIERAKTAAGFWHVNLSPLHGALISAAIANDGVMMRPSIVDRMVDKNGRELYRFKAMPWLVSMHPSQARQLSVLSENTTVEGTAMRTFRGRSDWPKDLRVSGKTGTLSNKQPYFLYTWFVGWAPLEKPKIAVGALVVNTEKWWIKGTHVAANAILSYYRMGFQSGGRLLSDVAEPEELSEGGTGEEE